MFGSAPQGHFLRGASQGGKQADQLYIEVYAIWYAGQPDRLPEECCRIFIVNQISSFDMRHLFFSAVQ